MTERNLRRLGLVRLTLLPLLVLFAAGLLVGGVARTIPAAFAACTGEARPLRTVTGDAVTASMEGWDYTIEIRLDDGTLQTVKLFGRRAPADGTAVENTVEDSYVGRVPEVGGRYTITGSIDATGALRVDGCVLGADVSALAEPPNTTTPRGPGAATSDGGAPPEWALVTVATSVGFAVVVSAGLMVRRRLRRRGQPRAPGPDAPIV